MKTIDPRQQKEVLSQRLQDGEVFSFRCHKNLACFNKCCRNLNLFLYPYDVLRLKNRLSVSSGQFLDTHVDMVLRESNYFPDVLLKMTDNFERTCPFLTQSGCAVYPDRPDACRTFPLEQGILFEGPGQRARDVYFFRPPDFCLGQHELDEWTTDTWAQDQGAVIHHKMTAAWAELKGLFQNDPWGSDGPYGPKAKMALMATYNVDAFRDFVFKSTFLRRYKVKEKLLGEIKQDDFALMQFGFAWVKFFVWGMKTKFFRLR